MTGKELRKWRVNKNLTQGKAADLLGVAYPTYKKWESEKRQNVDIPRPIGILIGLIGMH